MPEEKKYHNYTAADIEKYHKGQLSPEEMHQLEKAALDDPFLADALEGFRVSSANVAKEISELEKRLRERISGAKVVAMKDQESSLKWWKIVAAIVIVGGLGFLTYQISINRKNESLAKSGVKKDEPLPLPATDSGQSPKPAPIISTIKKIPLEDSPKKSPLKSSPKNADSNSVVSSVEISESSGYLNKKEEKYDSTNNKISSLDDSAPAVTYQKEESSSKIAGLALMKKPQTAKDEQQINHFRGHVTDENNNPLPFANITNTKDSIGTYADAEGNFTLITTDSILNVQVHSVGFDDKFTRLTHNLAGNHIILQEGKAAPDKVISYQRPTTERSRNGSMKFEEPEPADGWANYNTYLANNINIPDDLEMKPEGEQVELSFDINKNGEPVNIMVEKSLCQKCDEEAVRLIKKGPKWKNKTKKTGRITLTIPFDSHQ